MFNEVRGGSEKCGPNSAREIDLCMRMLRTHLKVLVVQYDIVNRSIAFCHQIYEMLSESLRAYVLSENDANQSVLETRRGLETT